MSGGSWDYFYHKLDDVADRLKGESSPVRRAFGKHLTKCAAAMRAIEWVDSCDSSPPSDDEAIMRAIGEGLNGPIAEESRLMAIETLELVKTSLEALKRGQPDTGEHTP